MEHFPEEILSFKKINDLALKQPFSFFGKNVLFKCLLLQRAFLGRVTKGPQEAFKKRLTLRCRRAK